MGVWNGVVIGGILFDNEWAYPNPDTRTSCSIQFILIAIVFSIGIVGYSMALSTFFYDTKVAQNMVQMALFIPLILFVAVVNQRTNTKYLTYLTFVTPIGPAGSIIGIITSNKLLTPEE
jgi:phosphoglycerol transferase MdoB-like AlkP superfamily enzyme